MSLEKSEGNNRIRIQESLIFDISTNVALIALERILSAVLPIRVPWKFVKITKSDDKKSRFNKI
jgi:hypothetical protein